MDYLTSDKIFSSDPEGNKVTKYSCVYSPIDQGFVFL